LSSKKNKKECEGKSKWHAQNYFQKKKLDSPFFNHVFFPQMYRYPKQPKTYAPIFFLGFVVFPMGSLYPIEVLVFEKNLVFYSSVNGDIVQDKIQPTVESNPQSNEEEWSHLRSTRNYQVNRRTSENQTKQIVQLEKPGVRPVMCFVNEPQWSVK